MRRLSISSILKEYKSKSWAIASRILGWLKWKTKKYWRGCKDIRALTHCWWERVTAQPLSQSGSNSNVKHGVTKGPSNPTPNYIPKRTEKSMFTQKLVHECSKQLYKRHKGKQLKFHLLINKMWSMHSMEYYLAIIRNKVPIHGWTWTSWCQVKKPVMKDHRAGDCIYMKCPG